LHTDDPKEANSETFFGPITEAGGVWFGGGRQCRLVDSYANTKTEKAFWDVLDRGGVIGGSSAGATIQGSYLARGDTKNNQIMMGDHEAGFGFIKNIAIDQHVLARNRQFDLFNILEKRPELLGVGLDEKTAMIVQGDQFEVMGESYVLVYDGGFWSREGSSLKKLPPSNQLFYFLRPGDKYDMAKREMILE
jgi:cyanophycinase